MRLLLPLVLLTLVALTASTVSLGQLYIKVTGAGFHENQNQKTWIVTLDVKNQDQEPQIIRPEDFQGKDAFGNICQLQGQSLELPPAANSSMSLMSQGKIAPRTIEYLPGSQEFDLKGWI